MLFGNQQDRRNNMGLLVIRIGLTATLLLHSLPILFGDSSLWGKAGESLAFINVGLSSKILGFLVLLLESFCGLSLITGYFFRVSSVVLTVLYSFHCIYFFSIGYKTLPLYAISIAAVYMGLIFVGPGRFVISLKLEKK